MDEFEKAFGRIFGACGAGAGHQSNDSGEFVTLMTLHAAKGLEYDYVFFARLGGGIVPVSTQMDEKWRLKVLKKSGVCLCRDYERASTRATICYVANRRMYGNWVNALPSRFVQELLPKRIQMLQS